MNMPLSQFYNLGRLGNAGDKVDFAADTDQRAAIAAWSGVSSLENFAVAVDITKLGPTRFRLDYRLVADVTQACVVTLEPVPAHIERAFSRELHYVGNTRRGTESEGGDTIVDPGTEEGPEDIESLHYDLAGPVLEEYSLALEPYPRRPGAEFSPESKEPDVQESPFAVLKGLQKRL
ncbi:MAG: hypothetical protein J0G99_15225 [Alphaproteobacteria bacterium]|nr:hypothetical protein [Alphaproteobacteria bacterium]